MQFGYDAQPSFWQGVSSNAHLIIAAVGTASLLCVAAVALWLAFPEATGWPSRASRHPSRRKPRPLS